MKKILFLTPFVPSNRAGGENFTRLLLEQLSFNNKIDLLYYRYADDPIYEAPNENVKVVKEVVNSMFVKLKNSLMHPTMHPIFTVRFNKSILTFIRNLFAENHYDLLYLDHTQMALYGKYFPSIKKILMSHDVMAQRYSRKGNFITRHLILKGEMNLMTLPNMTVFSFSDKDKKIIQDLYGVEGRVTDFFLDETIVAAKPSKIENEIVFFGKWNRQDNFYGLKWFFENVFQLLPKELRITIIGKWLPDDFVRKISMHSNVQYLGFVNNPYSLISNALAVVSPLFSGAGVKVKVVESLACGTPVIGSEIAFEGIPSDYCDFMYLAKTPRQYLKCLETIKKTKEDRLAFKSKFMKNYQQASIKTFVEE